MSELFTFIVDSTEYNALNDLGFWIEEARGLHSMPVEHISSAYALIEGHHYHRTRAAKRPIVLRGHLLGDDFDDLRAKRRALFDMFNPHRHTLPVTLRYQAGETADTALDIDVVYSGGLESPTMMFDEEITLRLMAHRPFWYAATLKTGDLFSSVSTDNISASDAYWRKISTRWSGTFSHGGGVQTFAEDIEGNLYAGGSFTGRVRMYSDSSNWATVGSLGAEQVHALLAITASRVYAGGHDSSTYAGVWEWDGATWTRIYTSSDEDSTVYALELGQDGNVYAGGELPTDEYAIVWDGVAWASIGAGEITSAVRVIKRLSGWRYLYVGGGAFAGGGDVGIYNTSSASWSERLPAHGGRTRALVFDPQGNPVIGAEQVGGSPAVATWAGAGWVPVGEVVGDVYCLEIDDKGKIHAGGDLTSVDGRTLEIGLAEWTGATWTHSSIINIFDDVPIVAMLLPRVAPYGMLISGGGTTLIGGGGFLFDYDGDIPNNPVIEMTGPGRVWRLSLYKNVDAKNEILHTIYFDLELAAGEVATLDLRPESRSFVSTVQGNVMSSILPVSDLADFTVDTLSSPLFVGDTTVTVDWSLQERYSSASGKLMVYYD